MKSKKIKKVKKKVKKSKTKITKNMKIGDVVKKNPKAVKILIGEGMFCVGCPMAMKETLEQACETHGVDIDKLLKKLNK